MHDVSWIHKDIELFYKIGTYKLFSLSLRAFLLNAHFAAIQSASSSLIQPPESDAGSWDCTLIRQHPTENALSAVARVNEYLRYVPYQGLHYYIDMKCSFEEYLHKFNHKARYNLLRSVRLYTAYCGSEKPWQEYRRPEEMEEFQRLAGEVSRKTYQERLLKLGFPKSPEYLAILKEKAANDDLRGYILSYKEKPVAYLCCSAYQKVYMFYDYIGYDPEYKKWSPGTILVYFGLRNMFAEKRYEIFDLTDGVSTHKEYFSNGRQWCADVYYFRASLKGRLIVFSHRLLTVFSHGLAGMLDRFGLKEYLKKLFK